MGIGNLRSASPHPPHTLAPNFLDNLYFHLLLESSFVGFRSPKPIARYRTNRRGYQRCPLDLLS
jgi:hypothetical protein